MLHTADVLDVPIQEFYNRTALVEYMGANIHDRFAEMKALPQGHGNTVKFRRWPHLDSDNPENFRLKPGVPNNADQMTLEDVYAHVYTYGNHVQYEDEVLWQSADPLLTIFSGELGSHAGAVMDKLRRDTLVTGTNVTFEGAATDRDGIAATLSAVSLRVMVRTMKRNNAKRITKMGNGTTQVGTKPIAPAYIGLVHPDTTAQLKLLEGFVEVKDYPSSVSLLPEEVGSFDEIRFIESTNCKVWEGAGAALGTEGAPGAAYGAISGDETNADVYATIIIAAKAYGIVDVRGKNLQIIPQPLGSGGAADPYRQVGTVAWKATTGTVILDDRFLGRIEHCNSVSLAAA